MTLLSILAIITALATTMPMAGQTLDEDFDRLDKTLGMAADYVAAHESKTSAIRELLDSRNASPAEVQQRLSGVFPEQ